MDNNLICRTCLQISTAETCKDIEEIEKNSAILEMLSYSIPEMNMHLVIQPVICNKCVGLLQTLYKFKSQCLKIEENILRYAQAMGTSKINLMEYQNRKIKCIESKNNNCYKEVTSSTSQKRKDIAKNNYNEQKFPDNNNTTCKGCKGCKVRSLDPIHHLKTNHAPFVCFHCNKELVKIIDLRRHILGHIKQRKCKICGKGFRDLTTLRRHLWSHTGAKLFACNICPKRFQQKHCLEEHMFKHQGNDVIKCNQCQKLFSTKYNAKVHMKTAHKKVETCDLCGETFLSKRKLVEHLETNSEKCGNVIKKVIQNYVEDDSVQDDFIKTEPEFISIDENWIEGLPNAATEYNINDQFPHKVEFCNVKESLTLPKKEEVVEFNSF